MTTRFLETDHDRRMLIRFIEGQPLPLTVSVGKGGKRSLAQNKLQRLWINEISQQLGDMTPEEVRGYCKLTLGVPILRAEREVRRRHPAAPIRIEAEADDGTV